MANPAVQGIIDQATKNIDAEKSAVIVLNGFQQRLTDAVAKALQNGATEAELAPVQAEIDLLKTSADDLAAAVVANTPAAAPKKP